MVESGVVVVVRGGDVVGSDGVVVGSDGEIVGSDGVVGEQHETKTPLPDYGL